MMVGSVTQVSDLPTENAPVKDGTGGHGSPFRIAERVTLRRPVLANAWLTDAPVTGVPSPKSQVST